MSINEERFIRKPEGNYAAEAVFHLFFGDKDGVLSVHLPKTEKAADTSHTIAINGAA